MTNPIKKPLGLPQAFAKGARITRTQPTGAEKVAAHPVALNPSVFWFLWAPGAYKPSRRHATLASATAEAARLRARFPGKDFPVFCAAQVQP
jgi:hypothetical protein